MHASLQEGGGTTYVVTEGVLPQSPLATAPSKREPNRLFDCVTKNINPVVVILTTTGLILCQFR